MPFKSEKQRKWMYANDPEMAKKWEKEEKMEVKESHTVQFTKDEMEILHRDGKLEKDGHTYVYADDIEEAKKRDYKAEYKKFQSSTKMKKYRAELNKYNRKKGTYGNGDGKDASHKGGKIVGFEAQSKNRGRREKSRLKKEQLISMIRKIINEENQNGRNTMARKKVKETSKKANSKALKSKKSSVSQIKLYDLLPEEEKNKINQIMDDIDITDERVMSKFSPMIKEWEASVKGFTGISEFLKFSDKKLHGKMEKMSETIEEIGNHLEGIIGKISSKK